MIFLFCSDVFVLKIRKPSGIMSNGTSFDNAENVSLGSTDQK